MSKFTEYRDYKKIGDNLYKTLSPVAWEIGRFGSGLFVEIPENYEFQFSNPKPLWFLQSPHDQKVLMGGALHDWLTDNNFDVAFASSEMRRACIALGTPVYKAWIIFVVTFIFVTIRNKLNAKKIG